MACEPCWAEARAQQKVGGGYVMDYYLALLPVAEHSHRHTNGTPVPCDACRPRQKDGEAS